MTSTYTPDYWKVIKVTNNETKESHHRVICSWSGSYMWGSSWKISSGIETMEDRGDTYESKQTSGSVYILRKTREGISGIMEGILSQYNELPEQTIEVVDSEQFYKDFNNFK